MSNSDKEKLNHVNDKLITKTKIFNSNKLKKTENNFNLIHWNPNSLNNKIDEFKLFCNKYKPHIVSINETKMSDFNANHILDINNYTTIHKSRSVNINGAGGVALLIRKDVNFIECNFFETLNVEICAINVNLNGKDICIVSYYNPPNLSLNENIFNTLKQKCQHFIILGDLNAKSKLWGAEKNNSNGDILDNLILEYDCIIINNKEPTHVSYNGRSSNILDYCIISTNLFNIFNEFIVLNEDDMTSDHLPFLVKLEQSRNYDLNNERDNETNIKKYNFNKADWSRFKQLLPTCFEENIGKDVEALELFIRNSIIEAANKSIPTYKSNNKNQKQFPKHILSLIKARQLARKLTQKDRNCSNAKSLYNKLTKTIRAEIRAMKDTEWREFTKKLGTCPPSTKPFWDRINTIRGKKKKATIPTLKVDKTIYESDESKAQLFSSILHKTFSMENGSEFDDKFKEKVDKNIKNFDFKNHGSTNVDIFDIRDLNLVIKDLKKNAACGEDNIHNLMLKNSTQDFRKQILVLINETVKQSKIPQSWKNSIVSMIPKKVNNSSCPKDYRPISLTSCLAKVAERLMLVKIKEFLHKNKIIIKQQSGFRQKRQTKDNIFHLTQKAIESLNRGKRMCTILFDIASAFDKVWHEGLIFKLIKLNFPKYIICWIKEFLTNRYFAIRVNKTVTTKLRILAGVPQGAVISPTLFSLFINDIPILYSKNKWYSLLFADDLCSSHIYKNKKSITKRIQSYLNRIDNWLKMWRLSMASNKCNYIVFSNDKLQNGEETLDIKLRGCNINKSENPMFLGIRYDKHLSFKNQLEYLKESCLKRVNVLKVLANRNWGLSVRTLTQVYISLIRSLLEYSSIIYPCISATNLSLLEKVQFKCLKIINRKSKFSSNREIIELDGYQSIEKRFDQLNINYIKNNIINKNELFTDLLDEYWNYIGGREVNRKTLLCKYKEEIKYIQQQQL